MNYQKQRAFTLAEMAIVVVVLGIILTMGLKMAVSMLNNAALSETTSKQARIKIALINYLRTNGKLPCPEIQTLPANVATYGFEGRAPIGGDVACTAVGGVMPVLPWITLGLSRDDVVDGWGNFFTYRVASIASDNVNWTSRTAIAPAPHPFSITELANPTTLQILTIKQGDGVNPLVTSTSSAVVAIISHGKNGFGARTVKGPVNVAPTGVDELSNATPYAATPTFVIRPYTESGAATGGPFDDVVIYMTPQDLLQPLTNEGTLQSCRSYCLVSTACTGSTLPYSFCTGSNQPPMPPAQCTGNGLPYTFCTASGRPAAPEATCTGVGAPYTFCTGNGTPVMPLTPCTGLNAPYNNVCTANLTPTLPTTGCTGVGVPYSFCTANNTPVASCLATNVPIGSRITVCP